MKYYTGVGSRETPQHILDLMKKTGRALASQGWTLRSGGAKGADNAFELGWLDWHVNNTRGFSTPLAEIYVPWSGYEGHDRGGLFGAIIVPSDIHFEIESIAEGMAMAIHPAWEACKQGARKMHTRNVFQVLGKDLDSPSKMLIAWTRLDGKGNPKGGTATAINLALENGVKVFNLNRPEDFDRVNTWIEGMK